MRTIWLGMLAIAAASAAAAPARAATTCVFDARGQRLVLRADCETDASIAIPDGVTLDGRGHRIVAVDPPGGHFLGAIVRNAGTTAHVRNLVLDTRALASVCDDPSPADQRLAGILFEAASGTIVGNRVLNINQGESGCQEGAAIAVRAAEEGPLREVRIAGNRVEGYQKSGIVVNGNASAVIDRNRVVGLGPIDFIGQNGIQIGFGARGTITRNAVSQNIFTLPSAASACVLLLNAGPGVEVEHNAIEDCDVGVSVVATSSALVRANRISNSTYDGIAVDSRTGEASASLILLNLLIFNGTGIGIYGPQAEDNAVESNLVFASSVIDIFNTGANTYSGNRCASSSGPPVDCP